MSDPQSPENYQPGDILTESGVNVSHYRREKAKHGDQWIPKRDETGKKHVVNVSGGLCSFWAWKRVVDYYGPKNVIPLFADTLIEDPDLYKFNDQCAALLGTPIVRVCHGMNPWELFRSEGMIGNARFKICSIRLKREMLDQWHRENCMEMDTVIYIGFNSYKPHRLEAMREAKPFWRIEAPMMEEPIWDKCRMIREAEVLGLDIPRLYRLGFPHNNCGGACVAAGISHFVHLLRVLPEVYATWEREELATQAELKSRGIDDSFTMLKDRRGGVQKSLSLQTLRLRVEAGETFPRDEWGGCGCGVMYDTKEGTDV